MEILERLIISLLIVTVLSYLLKLWDWDLENKFEYFGKSQNYTSGVCDNKVSHKMCLEMAGNNCRIPTYPNEECWMSVYNRCRDTCNRNVSGDCKCTQVANQQCVTRDDPADACLSSVYQKCMAGRTDLVEDPDRGSTTLFN